MIAAIKNETGETIKQVLLEPTKYKTGSRGFYGSSYMDIENKRYFINFRMVEKFSKLNTE